MPADLHAVLPVIDPTLLIDVVRLGYLLSALLWMGATLPGWAAVMLPEESGINVPAMYGRSADAVLAGWVRLTEFLLSRADEARQLMGKLGLA